MRWVILVLCLLCSKVWAGGDPYFYAVVPDTLDPKLARAVIEEIWDQSQIYFFDRGKWPESLQELITANYVSLSPEAQEQWEIRLNYGFMASISARPRYDLEGKGKKSRINLHWLGQRSVTFDAITGQWSGYEIPDFRADSLSVEDEADLTIEVRRLMQLTAEACDTYYMERGAWPTSFEELRRSKYVWPSVGVYVQWEITLMGNRIEAYSTHVMPAGSGHMLSYDVEHDTFEGFGATGREKDLPQGLFKERKLKRAR